MAYRVENPHTLDREIRRIVEDQVDRCVAEINDRSLSRHATAHQVRKRCKKIRGVIRLLRGPLDNDDIYTRENRWYRDAARELSYVRDAEALVETFDGLMEHFKDQVDQECFASVRNQLTRRRKVIADQEVELDERLEEFLNKMQEGRKRVADWSQRAQSFDDLLPGLAKSYRRGRKAMANAYDQQTADSFHEWRKRAKYHWYHNRLLQGLWNREMNARNDELSQLSDLLGDEHDLSVFLQTILQEGDSLCQGTTREALLGLVEKRREVLRSRARPLGQRLYAEKPDCLSARLSKYWDVWSWIPC